MEVKKDMFNNSTGFTMPVAPIAYGGYGYSNNGNNGMFGDGGWWAIIILLALFGGFGRGGFGGFGGNFGESCATQSDVRNAVDQQTLISKLDQQTYGLADTFTALNNSINSNFRGVDNAICTLGYQNQQGFSGISSQLAQCCCDIERAIDGNTTQGVMNTNSIQRQISDCCCDLEKMNMQNRFDAQTYNCNTLQAIDKLGDRIEGRLSAMENAKLREQLDNERTKNAVLQGTIDRAQLRDDIVNDVRPFPIPAYPSCNPFASSFGFGNGFGFNGFNNGCGCGNGFGFNNNCGCGCNC